MPTHAFLPHQLHSVSGAPVSLRSGRGPVVLILLHSTTCAACRSYLDRTQDGLTLATEWGAHVHIVVRELAAARGAMPPREISQVLVDRNAKLAADAPSVMVADEWGEVYFSMAGGAEHELPSAQEIADWARFIAIQCPECEQPEGEWKTL